MLASALSMPAALLENGGARLLAAPEAVFAWEIQAMHLGQSNHRAIAGTNDFFRQSDDAEFSELCRALRERGTAAAEAERIAQRHQAERDKLQALAKQMEAWRQATPTMPSGTVFPPKPALSAITVLPELPAEFADYFRGAIRWHSGDTNGACTAWEQLLRRPPSERRFRSTWAAFMLGKSHLASHPARAVKYFQQVRTLAQEGFADSLGLAASSLGWEARVELRRQDFARAIDLYLDQAATGDESALVSLRFAAAQAVEQGARSFRPLAAHPRAQRVITAWMIAGGWRKASVDVDGPLKESLLNLLSRQTVIRPPGGDWHTRKRPVLLWLDAVEAAGSHDSESAEKLALLAYQAGEIETARRWLSRSTNAPTSQWLQAKLLLRDGRAEDATAILAKLVRQFPADRGMGPSQPRAALPERLGHGYYWNWSIPAPTRMLGEFGALQLAGGDYADALDALLRAGYWDDARYVADRVLTLPEFQAYVDRYWPEQRSPDDQDSIKDRPYFEHYPGEFRESIRRLLGQRLIRAGRPREARSYLPSYTRSILDTYLDALTAGRDTTFPAGERAESLRQAAVTVEARGYDLFTAPAHTDWRVQDGLFTHTIAPPARLAPADQTVLPIPFDERLRTVQTAVYPVRSWHYRFHAAELAWEAAQLMPDDSDETAAWLWQAGSWIKYLDPKTADRFYKALVLRCPNTALGREAERRRWFPASAAVELKVPTPNPPAPTGH